MHISNYLFKRNCPADVAVNSSRDLRSGRWEVRALAVSMIGDYIYSMIVSYAYVHWNEPERRKAENPIVLMLHFSGPF